MKNQFLEAGQIVNTHGIRGEVKIVPWCDSPEFLCSFSTLYLDGAPIKVRAARVHKGNVLAQLEGVDDVNAAMRLKNKVLHINRADVQLPEGRHFLADLVGLTVIDDDTGETIGTLTEVLTPPAHEVYVVRGETKEYLIPAVDAFLRGTNVDEGWVRVHLIDGMGQEI